MTVKILTYEEARILTEIHDCEVFVIPVYENLKAKRVIRFLADDGQEYGLNKGIKATQEKLMSTFGGLEKTLNTVFKGNVQQAHFIIPPLPDNLDLKSLLAQTRNSKVPSD